MPLDIAPHLPEYENRTRFCAESGDQARRAWDTARRRSGVQVRFHDLRHTTVTRLLESGRTLEELAPILGWSPTTMAEMMKIYQHRGLENKRKTMMVLVNGQRKGKNSGGDEQDASAHGDVSVVNRFLTLLNGNRVDMTLIAQVERAVNEKIAELGQLQILNIGDVLEAGDASKTSKGSTRK